MAKKRDVQVKLKVDAKTGIASVKKTKESFKDLERHSKKTAESMTSGFGKVKKAMVALAGAAAIGAVVNGFKNMLFETVALGDKFHKLNRKLGISTELLSKLEHHADLSGVAFGAVTSSIERFQRRLALAERGIGAGAKGFENLGVNIDQMLKLTPDEQFLRIAERVERIEDPVKRSAAAFEIFGMTGAELTKMLPDLRNQLKGISSALTQADANLMAEFTDQMADFNRLITTIKMEVFSNVLKEIVPKIGEWTKANRELIAVKVEGFVNNTITAVNSLVVVVNTLLLLLKPAAFIATGYAIGTVAVGFGLLSTAIRNAAGQNLLFVKSGSALNNVLAVMKTRLAAVSVATRAGFAGLGAFIGWEIGQALNKIECIRKGAEHTFNLVFSVAKMAFVKIRIAFIELVDFMKKKWLGLQSWFNSMKNARNLKDMLQHPDKYKPGDFGFEPDPKLAELTEQLEDLATQFQLTKDLIGKGNGLLNDVEVNPFAATTPAGGTDITNTDKELFDYQAFADKYYEKTKANYEKRKELTMNYYAAKDAMFQRSLAIQDELRQEAFDKEQELLKKQREQIDDISKSFSEGMTDALFEWIDGTKSAEEAFKDFAKTFLNNIAKMIIEQETFNMLQSISGGEKGPSLLGGIISGIGGMFGGGASAGPAHVGAGGTTAFGMAEGGIAPGGFKAFANGGVVNKPTLGLIGEGNTNEAIVPLLSGNKIPVQFTGKQSSAGGNVFNINLTYHKTGGKDTSEKEDKESAKEMVSMVQMQIEKWANKAQRPGGRFNQSGNSGGY